MPRVLLYAIALVLTTLLVQSCYYDVEEELYGTLPCDTSNVTFELTVKPIIGLYCLSCHTGTNSSGNIAFDSYAQINAQAANGALTGAINHAAGFSPMPKNGSQLSFCERRMIQIWIDAGHPDN